MRSDCTCGAAGFGHEPDCLRTHDTDHAAQHTELLADTDREELIWP